MISVSDWISIICAVVALIVTVIIAVLQIRQSNRMERFEKRQDKRDEQRHQESVKAQAVSFISKYYKDRGLIPLCAIATMYNDLFYYNREMYREFCCCTKEVQNRILEYCGLDLRVSEYSIYEKCFDDEPATVAMMDKYLEENGYVNDFTGERRHHEIYLSDPRKVAPEKCKTVIRHPIKKA